MINLAVTRANRLGRRVHGSIARLAQEGKLSGFPTVPARPYENRARDFRSIRRRIIVIYKLGVRALRVRVNCEAMRKGRSKHCRLRACAFRLDVKCS